MVMNDAVSQIRFVDEASRLEGREMDWVGSNGGAVAIGIIVELHPVDPIGGGVETSRKS